MALPALRVAFDMDGTVADMHTMLSREAERLFGAGATGAPRASGADGRAEAAAPPTDVPIVVARDELPLTRPQLQALWAHVERIENFWTTLPEMAPGIVARIEAAARARRWEVLFITARPPTAGDPVQLQTQRWLRAHGFEYPAVCVLERSRGRLADVLQLHAVADDRPENCMDVAMDSKARPLLIWPPGRAASSGLDRLGVRRVASIGDALKWLEAFDDRRRQSPVIRSVRKFLGHAD